MTILRRCLLVVLLLASGVAAGGCPENPDLSSIDACLRSCTDNYTEKVTRAAYDTCNEKVPEDDKPFPWADLVTTLILLVLSGPDCTVPRESLCRKFSLDEPVPARFF